LDRILNRVRHEMGPDGVHVCNGRGGASNRLASMPTAGVDLSGHWTLNVADSDDAQRLMQARSRGNAGGETAAVRGPVRAAAANAGGGGMGAAAGPLGRNAAGGSAR